MNLRNKKVLITAGPTWVAIDSVRVISNIATGETGILLAEKLQRSGARVTLLLGPVGLVCRNNKIKLLRFKSFGELKDLIRKELSLREYDIVIHSAAVSDFKIKRPFKGKFKSGRGVNLKLIPLPKIIKDIRGLAGDAKLVMFKLEVGISDRILTERAKKAMISAGADFVVANRLDPYRAFIMDRSGGISFAVRSKDKLVRELLKTINYQL